VRSLRGSHRSTPPVSHHRERARACVWKRAVCASVVCASVTFWESVRGGLVVVCEAKPSQRPVPSRTMLARFAGARRRGSSNQENEKPALRQSRFASLAHVDWCNPCSPALEHNTHTHTHTHTPRLYFVHVSFLSLDLSTTDRHTCVTPRPHRTNKLHSDTLMPHLPRMARRWSDCPIAAIVHARCPLTCTLLTPFSPHLSPHHHTTHFAMP
jgi:hypothetical protein